MSRKRRSSDDDDAATKRVKITSKPKSQASLKPGVAADDKILRNPLVFELPIRIPIINCRLYDQFVNLSYRPELDWGSSLDRMEDRG